MLDFITIGSLDLRGACWKRKNRKWKFITHIHSETRIHNLEFRSQALLTELPGLNVYLFVGHVNRHWGAFAKRCINNRTIRHNAKGAVPIVYYLRKMHLWGSKLHAGYSISLRFYLGWSAFWGRCKKNRVRPYYIIWQKGGGFLGGAEEWFQRSHIIVMLCLWFDT